MTFFVTTDWMSDWAGFQEAADNGHEIASHSLSHPDLNSLDEDERMAQLQNYKDIINNNITGHQCVTFAYPYCSVIDDAETAAYYISARTCNGQIESSTPGNLMQVGSILCGDAGPVNISDNFTEKVNSAMVSNGWVVFLLHGIDNDGGYSPVASE